MTRTFPLDEILSVSTGRLVCDRHMEAMYDLLGYMTQDQLWTHQLPRAMKECQPYLLQIPNINKVDESGLDRLLKDAEESNGSIELTAACQAWVASEKERLGLQDGYEISPIPKDDHDVIHPVSELASMVPPDKIITVNTVVKEEWNERGE